MEMSRQSQGSRRPILSIAHSQAAPHHHVVVHDRHERLQVARIVRLKLLCARVRVGLLLPIPWYVSHSWLR